MPDIRRAREAGTASATPPTADGSIVQIAGDREAMTARLAQLEAEWSLEQVIRASEQASSIIGTGISLARRRGLLRLNLPMTVAALVLQYGMRGARPPVRLLRRWGFRPDAEIERERHALLVLLGAPRDAFGPRRGPSPRENLTSFLRGLGRRSVTSSTPVD